MRCPKARMSQQIYTVLVRLLEGADACFFHNCTQKDFTK